MKNQKISFDIIAYVKTLLDKYNVEGYKTSVEYRFDGRQEVIGIGLGAELAGACDPDKKTIIIYVGACARALQERNALTNRNLKAMLRQTVRHECRHSSQFEYLRSLDDKALCDAILRENLCKYGSGKLELDANLAGFIGLRLPFRWVFKRERKEAEARKTALQELNATIAATIKKSLF